MRVGGPEQRRQVLELSLSVIAASQISARVMLFPTCFSVAGE